MKRKMYFLDIKHERHVYSNQKELQLNIISKKKKTKVRSKYKNSRETVDVQGSNKCQRHGTKRRERLICAGW